MTGLLGAHLGTTAPLVAQTGSLLCRGLATRPRPDKPARMVSLTPCRMPIGVPSPGGDFQQLGIAERNLPEAKAGIGPSDREGASQRQEGGGRFNRLHPFSKSHLNSTAFIEEPIFRAIFGSAGVT